MRIIFYIFFILSSYLNAADHKVINLNVSEAIKDYKPLKNSYSAKEISNLLIKHLDILNNPKTDVKNQINSRLKLASLLSMINLEKYSLFIRKLCENISYEIALKYDISLYQFAQMRFILAETYHYSNDENKNLKAASILKEILKIKDNLLSLDNPHIPELIDFMQSLLASIYYWGDNIPKNYLKAAENYEDIVNRNNSKDILMPLYYLGKMYIEGGNKLKANLKKGYGFLQLALAQDKIDKTITDDINKLLKKIPTECTIQ